MQDVDGRDYNDEETAQKTMPLAHTYTGPFKVTPLRE